MKNLVYLLLFFTLPIAGFSQSNKKNDQAEEETEPAKKVLVIPFHPTKYYFSDCDKNLAARSKQDREDIRYTFRAGMDYAAEQWIDKHNESINILQMKDSISKATLEDFYNNVSYAYDAPTRPLAKTKENFFKRMKTRLDETGKKRNRKEVKEDEKCYSTLEGEDDQYMKAIFKNKEFFDGLIENYSPDLIVTINQFEVKTDFEKCIDRDLGKYRRRIKVHYNVFNKDGKLMYGDVVTAKYNSTSNDVNRIIQDNFGFLAEYITQSMP